MSLMPCRDVTKCARLGPNAFNIDLAKLMMRAPKCGLAPSDSLTDCTGSNDQATPSRAIIGCCILSEACNDSRNIAFV